MRLLKADVLRISLSKGHAGPPDDKYGFSIDTNAPFIHAALAELQESFQKPVAELLDIYFQSMIRIHNLTDRHDPSDGAKWTFVAKAAASGCIKYTKMNMKTEPFKSNSLLRRDLFSVIICCLKQARGSDESSADYLDITGAFIKSGIDVNEPDTDQPLSMEHRLKSFRTPRNLRGKCTLWQLLLTEVYETLRTRNADDAAFHCHVAVKLMLAFLEFRANRQEFVGCDIKMSAVTTDNRDLMIKRRCSPLALCSTFSSVLPALADVVEVLTAQFAPNLTVIDTIAIGCDVAHQLEPQQAARSANHLCDRPVADIAVIYEASDDEQKLACRAVIKPAPTGLDERDTDATELVAETARILYECDPATAPTLSRGLLKFPMTD